MGSTIRIEDLQHEYGRTEEVAEVRALKDVNLEIAAGDFAILRGPSGSGKSTLLNLIGAVDRPTSGRILFDGRDITQLSEGDLTLLRRNAIGFIFQFFNLVPTLNVSENVGFSLLLAATPRAEVKRRVGEILASIGLEDRAKHYPNQLSGGEMQRVAIGRAIIHRPPLILADEPTGNLDTHTGEVILQLIRAIHEDYEPTIVMATHSERAASFGDYVVDVVDGMVTRA